eukprot:TRINITY_DN7726_c0_g1_i1.p1 TRINITY_DN7726_c0_g1~~TRINITY_DN7726_c0_g1_i1.p1  ORF type:complete len:122 (-),score=30.43 TRINITY_DN7726_c0_g1_i1:72-437(-)
MHGAKTGGNFSTQYDITPRDFYFVFKDVFTIKDMKAFTRNVQKGTEDKISAKIRLKGEDIKTYLGAKVAFKSGWGMTGGRTTNALVEYDGKTATVSGKFGQGNKFDMKVAKPTFKTWHFTG